MRYDVVVIGAGAAGMMCAAEAGRRGRSVLVLEHTAKVGSKILISGGGRCNFTNLDVGPKNFVSRDPNFSSYALQHYGPRDFVRRLREHGIPFHEKKLGQLFCDRSAKDIVAMLTKECERFRVKFGLETLVRSVRRNDLGGFEINSDRELFSATAVVVATGGLSFPQIGASGLGYEIAKGFGLKIIPRHPALDGFLFSEEDRASFAALSGLSLDCELSCRGMRFRENILFTHRGLSGPAALQISLHWEQGEVIEIDLVPDVNVLDWLRAKCQASSGMLLKNALSEKIPLRFAEYFVKKFFGRQPRTGELGDCEVTALAESLERWTLQPRSTVGYNKAEVTRGGVDTAELHPESMEARRVPGLYFIGEVVDVTGWLGGYNFQWAWSSAWVAAQAL